MPTASLFWLAQMPRLLGSGIAISHIVPGVKTNTLGCVDHCADLFNSGFVLEYKES